MSNPDEVVIVLEPALCYSHGDRYAIVVRNPSREARRRGSKFSTTLGEMVKFLEGARGLEEAQDRLNAWV